MSKMAAAAATSSSASSSTTGLAQPAGTSQPHLCLRWNNYQSNLTSVFDQLLQNETFVDVTLAADGHAIKAHRMVLSACSPYFQHLFFDNPCQHPIVILKDTRWPELKAIVEYMYRGEISVAQEELTSLLRVAETLKIRGLSELNSDHSRKSQQASVNIADDRSEASPLVVHPARRMVSESPTWPLQVQPWPEETGTPSPSPSPAAMNNNRFSAAKRRRVSGSESPVAVCPSPAAASTPGGMMQTHEAMDDTPLSLVQQQPPPLHQHNNSPTPPNPVLLSHHSLHSDDLDIKPGIAELIREEERARMLEGTHPWLTASPSVLSESLVQWRSKAPSWTKETLQEAINSIVTQKMRFTQASSHYNIPKGTLYDNILGKSKRMLVLDELGLDPAEEEAVLDFCCETSVMPYNRRTNKSLESVLAFVEKLKSRKPGSHPGFKLGSVMGFRWWWAFCKKHNIVSLFYVKNNNNNNNNNNNSKASNKNKKSSSPGSSSASSSSGSSSNGGSNNNNNSPSPQDELMMMVPENLSKPSYELDESESSTTSPEAMAAAAAAAAAFRSINNNSIHLSQALQLSHAFLLQQQHQRHNLRCRTHSVDHDDDSDDHLEPENLSVHKA